MGLKTAQVCLKILDAGKIEIFTDDKQTCNFFGYIPYVQRNPYVSLPRKNLHLTDSFWICYHHYKNRSGHSCY